jgi:3'-phosphoadenosine 5'-phosphosulfate sulfotransferase (PAPS reductase)/FAD synthetase
MALPGNKIPRVYANTGIEYKIVFDFVEREREREHPWELIIIKPSVPIRETLEKEGYPFKSKQHAETLSRFQNRGMSKWVKLYLEDGHNWSGNRCPKMLKYQFEEGWDGLKVSDKCCKKLKEEPLQKWQKENNKPIAIIGIMPDEGGRRASAQCIAWKNKKKTKFNFQPLVPVTKEWENWLIEKYSITICDIYYPPYNFDREGCKGCPFNIHLQRELDTLQQFFPEERKQCEIIWKPVYDEYRRIGYRLRKSDSEGYQRNMFDL